MQSTLEQQGNGLHVAIIMDGNGRWAERRDLPRIAGHREGIEAVRRVVEAAPTLGISTLTLFAFSSDNWRRPPLEVEALMLLLRNYLRRDVQRLIENGVRLKVIGRRDRLPDGLGRRDRARRTRDRAQLPSRSHRRARLLGARRDRECRNRLARRSLAGAPRVHAAARAARATAAAATSICLIRTGGEKRLSDFLLWECAYAELAVHRNDVAGLRRRAPARRARRFSRTRAPLWRPSGRGGII